MVCLTWFYQHLIWLQLLLLYSQGCARSLCSHDQSSALLQFKQLVSSENSSFNSCDGIQQSYPKSMSWKEDDDCCSWDGLTCDMVTGHVIGLDLSCSWLYGYIPSNSSLFLLHHLNKLNLAYNNCNYSQVPSGFGGFTGLTLLNLSSCNFMGSIPASLGNLTQLTNLDLSFNDFNGQIIPSSLSNLKQLNYLDLSHNNFIGEIPGIFFNLTQLSYLDLSSNQLTGLIPSSVSGLLNLATIRLSYNSLNGITPSRLFTLPSLELIDLSHNQLTGSIPSSVFELVNLKYLDISSNNFSGNLELYMFAKLKNLELLGLSYNSLSLSTKIKDNTFFTNLTRLGLSACNINEFPDNLRSLNQLEALALSENKIYGNIPNWMWNTGKDTLYYLNLSHNFLTSIEHLPWKNLQYLDLQSNLLQGSLTVPPPFMLFFSVSNNKLTGEIPSSFCNLSSIRYLDLSNNRLNGTIPQCLGYSMLRVLDLQMNNFDGGIPQSFTKSCDLNTLNVNDNQLEGPLPQSLVNCTNLQVLDVGKNMLNDTFPHWLADLPRLRVLILRSNKFHGPIGNSNTRFPFPKLRILDLSHDEFTGVLPTRYLQNFEAMMNVNYDGLGLKYLMSVTGQYYSMILTMKGISVEMERILTIFTTIDLSSNRFEGRISEVVGKLNSLKGLNFSNNNLTGSIPPSMGNLKALESLDLSSNKLVGNIPWQLTNLTSLSALNLSYNQLEGPIPKGLQFNTFQDNSYIGNSGLCGFPLSKKCGNNEALDPGPTIFHEEDNTSSWFDWKVAMMGYGAGLMIGLSMGYIVFATRRPRWFVKMLERKQSKS